MRCCRPGKQSGDRCQNSDGDAGGRRAIQRVREELGSLVLDGWRQRCAGASPDGGNLVERHAAAVLEHEHLLAVGDAHLGDGGEDGAGLGVEQGSPS